MKFKMHGIFLSLFFALALCFSFSLEVSAHDYERSDGQHTYTHPDVEGISAADVDPTNEDDVKKFLLHAVTHLDLINMDDDLDEAMKQEKSRETVIFAREARKRGGVFNDGDTYIIAMTQKGAVTNHGRYQKLLGNTYDLAAEPVRTLAGASNLSDGYNPTCETYGNQDRVACAIKQDTAIELLTTVMAGFDHAEGILMPPDCSDITLPDTATAKKVEDKTDLDEKRNLLKEYVKGFIAAYEKLQESTPGEVIAELTREDPSFNVLSPEGRQRATIKTVARVYEKTIEKTTCFSSGDFKYGSIYPFIMDPVRGTSYVNGLDFDLHGLSVSLRDPNPIRGGEPNVLVAFQKELTTGNTGDVQNDLEHGNNGFVTYHWAHPENPDHPVEGYLDDKVVPGDATKESYLEVVDIARNIPGAPASYFVFGSGIYHDMGMGMMPEMPEPPEMEAKDDDDGCSVAAAGSTHQSTLLNLFLVASVLFSVAVLRKRG